MISLVGAGNVATWIVERLRNAEEFRITQVYSRHLCNAERLASRCGAAAIDRLSDLDPDSNIYLFALSDNAYPAVLEQIPFKMPLALHTAGSVSQEVFAPFAEHYGVLYPLQTFSKAADTAELTVPLCMELDRLGERAGEVERLSAALSPHCHKMGEEQRALLHLAAVFACNFSNALCGIADNLLRTGNLDIHLLLPLLQQTVDKLKTMTPAEAQTGPARRGDTAVIEKHIAAIDSPLIQNIYRNISEYIRQQQLFSERQLTN